VDPWGLWIEKGGEEKAFSNFRLNFCFSSIFDWGEKKKRSKGKKRKESIPRKAVKYSLKSPKLNNVQNIFQTS